MILELLLNGNAPAAIVLCHTDEIIALGAIVAEQLFNKKLPVLCLEAHLQKVQSSYVDMHMQSQSITGNYLYGYSIL